ncbi:peptide N-acetyl-beta-D-glucosaminyl asparaginase amidase A-domain-containing protein [Chytridium lagenaria]|nr:peptide N-acetyl-beta-D-glucosaminyl asparaginase amidase A-domain-containing protein [Chytridium lagenaria]
MPKWREIALDYLKVLALQSISHSPSLVSSPPPFTIPPSHTESFEVSPPQEVPAGVTPCVVDLGNHDFAFSYGQPWTTSYNPPTECGMEWSKVVLVWTAYVAGRQFDRIIHVWLEGAELFRGISHEPSRSGIYWSVSSDITSYTPLLQKSNLTIVAACDNIMEFYPGEIRREVVPDVLVPLGKAMGYGYEVLNGLGGKAEFGTGKLPRNVGRVEVEYFVSNHARDEFYYTNVPDSYANPDNGVYGGGPYKELQVLVDGQLAGVDWPTPVIYTGGFNPLLWRPFVAIGASRLPTFKLDLTPYAGVLSDGKEHTITLNVTNQTPESLWFVDGILRIWVAPHTNQTTTQGPIQIDTTNPLPTVNLTINPTTNDATILTTLPRRKIRIQSTLHHTPSNTITNVKVESQLLSYRNHLAYTQNTNVVVGSHVYRVVRTVDVANVVDGVLKPLFQTFRRQSVGFEFHVGYTALSDDRFIVNTTLSQLFVESGTQRSAGLGNYKGDGWFGSGGGMATTWQKYEGRVEPVFGGVGGYNRTLVKSRVKETC